MRKAKISHFPASLPSFADKASVPNMPRRRRVAVCADDSPGSMRACRYAAQHLIDKDTDVVLVTAVHPTPTTNPAVRPRARATPFFPAKISRLRRRAPFLHQQVGRCYRRRDPPNREPSALSPPGVVPSRPHARDARRAGGGRARAGPPPRAARPVRPPGAAREVRGGPVRRTRVHGRRCASFPSSPRRPSAARASPSPSPSPNASPRPLPLPPSPPPQPSARR